MRLKFFFSRTLEKLGRTCDQIGRTLEPCKGYWQVPLTARAAEISAFVTPDYFLQYSVLAFGMRNAPATFQRLMHIVLGDVPNCDAYLDDIVIYSETWEDCWKGWKVPH